MYTQIDAYMLSILFLFPLVCVYAMRTLIIVCKLQVFCMDVGFSTYEKFTF